MKTTAKNLLLTALTMSLVVFAVDTPMTALADSDVKVAGAALPIEQLPIERLEADDQNFWDKFKDSVMKDKPEESDNPRVVERKPVEPPKEAEKPKPVERRAVATMIPAKKVPTKNPSEQNNPSPPYQPVQPPYQTPSPPYNPGTTPPPVARK